MKTFAYKGLALQGGSASGLVEAIDIKQAREKLAGRGVLVEQIRPLAEAGGWRASVVTRAQRAVIYREMGVLLGAGMPLVNALTLMVDSPEFGTSRVVLARVRDLVRDGVSLARALEQVPSGARDLETAVIEAGEASGSLDAMLERMAGLLEEQQRLHERVLSALIYPAIVLVVATVIAVVMLGFVVPSAARVLMESSNIRLPWITRFMMQAGAVLKWAVPVLALGGVWAAWGIRRRGARDAAFRASFDRRVFRIPLLRRARTLLANLRFARTLAVLIEGGMPVVDGLRLAGRASGSSWVAECMQREADAVRHGSSLADAIRRVPPLAEALPGWIQAGEASGTLERFLHTAADRYQYQWERFVARLLSVVEPALIALIGVFVLLVTLAVLMPVMALNRTLG